MSDSLQIDPPPSDGDFPTGNADLPDSPLATAMATVGGGAFDFTNQGTPQPEAARPSTAALEMEISDAVETQTRTLERLETLLHRLLTTRDHLAHIEERIDQLEAAHQVRSRL
ncbi:MAG: hypothetical protein ACKV0T_02755 [Planctomycetales bacterium]